MFDSKNNSLFKCFSMFLYNNEKYFSTLKNKIIEYIYENWSNFRKYTKLNIFNKDFKNSIDYKLKMNGNDLNGDILEIICFSLMFDIYISINNKNLKIFEFGLNKKQHWLNLSLIEKKSFKILNLNNHNIIKKIKNVQYLKSKSNTKLCKIKSVSEDNENSMFKLNKDSKEKYPFNENKQSNKDKFNNSENNKQSKNNDFNYPENNKQSKNNDFNNSENYLSLY